MSMFCVDLLLPHCGGISILTLTHWCMGDMFYSWLSRRKKKKKALLVALASFHTINTPTVVPFSMVSLTVALGRNAQEDPVTEHCHHRDTLDVNSFEHR